VNVADKATHVVNNALFPNAYDEPGSTAQQRGRDVNNQRGHRVYRVIEVDAATANARAVINEEVKTFFCYSGKKYRRDIADGKEVIWMSERDGWNHLYLYDGATGTVKNQITKGSWPVRSVVQVNEETRQIWFSASGMYPGKDPYFVHYYRINFDGTGLTPLTATDANHNASFSPDQKYYVDTYSRVDAAPVSELRRVSDRSLVMALETADISALVKAGWAPPEVFTAKGRDGQTDIWGVIYRPTDFSAAKKYPVIENIYAGPHSSFVPKSFAAFNQMQAQADLGFIVVQIDGMGTSNRSKAFHDVAWKNIKDAGFPDRILWHKAVAAKYPYLRHHTGRHLRHVGWRGGQNSLGALLFHPEFYKVAVSLAGATTTAWTRSGGTSSGWVGHDRIRMRGVVNVENAMAAGESPAGRRRNGSQRRSLINDAGRESAYQAQQELRSARRAGNGSRLGAPTAITSATTSSCGICST
jgi:hypothetical protein